MTSQNARKRLAPLLLMPLLLGASYGAYAYGDHKQATVSDSCKSARLSAWFERQRELTDGDTNPFVKAHEPAECAQRT